MTGYQHKVISDVVFRNRRKLSSVENGPALGNNRTGDPLANPRGRALSILGDFFTDVLIIVGVLIVVRVLVGVAW